jgi:hypothetical protein
MGLFYLKIGTLPGPIHKPLDLVLLPLTRAARAT